MNVLNLLCILSLVLLSAAAQEPKPCVVPPLMNGEFSLVDSSGFFPHSTGKMNYDAFGQRMLIRTLGWDGPFNSTTTDLLMHFNQKVYYVIDWNRFTCQKRPLDASFTPMQVPPGAKLMGQVILGSSSSWGMGVLVNTWMGFLPNNTGMYMSVFSEIGCIPMTMTSNTTEGLATISTYNWVLGNANPMEFIPPRFCARAQLDLTEKPDTFFTALKSLTQETKAEN